MFAFAAFVGLVNALLVDLSKAMGITVATAGQLSTVSGVSWSIWAPLIGPWSDRIGHKRTLCIGLTVFGISLIGFAVCQTFPALVVASFFCGVGGSMVPPSILASVADYYPAKSYGRAMAATNVATSLAYTVGIPGLVLIAGSLNWRWSFLSLAAFFFVCLLAVLVILPTLQHPKPKRGATYFSSFVEAFSEKSLLPMVLANLTLQAGYWAVVTYQAAYLILTYTLSTSELAPLISAIAAGQVVGVIAGGPLADRLNKMKICLIAGILLGATGFAFILLKQNVWLSVFLGALLMGFYGVGRPSYFSLMALVSNTVRGTVMGVQAVSNHLGRAVGAAIGGLALSLWGYQSLGVICLVLSVVATSIYVFLAFYMRKPAHAS